MKTLSFTLCLVCMFFLGYAYTHGDTNFMIGNGTFAIIFLLFYFHKGND